MDLLDALDAETGTTSVVGAGGKKTTLYALADRLDRTVLTATVRIPIFDRQVARVVATDEPIEALRAAATDEFPLGLIAGREGDRYRGYEPETVDSIIAAHDGPTLVKADGARTRECKAPGDHEPQLPATTDRVVPITSVAAVGKPLSDEFVHRPERVADLTDLDADEPLTADAIGTVLAHPGGGLKNVPEGAEVIPLLNKVDDATAERDAYDIADAFYDRLDRLEAPPRVRHVVLARMKDETIVETI